MVFWVSLVVLALVARYDLVVADPAPTSVSLTSITPDPQSLTYGDEITIVYQIVESPDVGGPPISGEVDLVDTANGNTVIDTIPVNANAGPPVTATYTKTLGAGTYSIQARYKGDTDHLASVSASIEELNIAKATTSISLVSITPDPQSLTYGEGITIVYQIIESPDVGGGPISGEVDLIDTVDNTVIDTIQVDVNAGPPVTATSIKILGAGAYSVRAQYKGDKNHFDSSSISIEEIIVVQDTPTIAFTTTPALTTIKYGQKVTFSALTVGTISPLFPDGEIEFKSSTNSDTYCTDDTVIDGVGECDKVFNVLGLYNIVSSYSGNSNYSAIESEAHVIHVEKDDSVVTFTYTLSPLLPAGSEIGQQITFTAKILGALNEPSFFPSSGKIEFRTASTVLCSQNSITSVNNEGIGTCQTTTSLNNGDYNVFARYYGNSFYYQDDSEKQIITIENIPSTLSLTINPIPPRNTPFAQPVTFTTIISARYNLNLHPPASPSGGSSSVIIRGRNNNNQLITLCTTTVISALGEAICITSTLPVSQYTQIIAYYSGTSDGKWLKSDTSNQRKSYRVTKALTSIEPIGPASQTILAGESVTLRFLIKEIIPTPGSPTGTVNLFNTNGGHVQSTQIQINALGQSIASFTVTTLRFGRHNLRARYLGNTNFADSTTTPPHAVVIVNQASPTYITYTQLSRGSLTNLGITHNFLFHFTNAKNIKLVNIVFNKKKIFDPFSPFQTKAIQINSDAGVTVSILPKASSTVLGYFNRLPPGTYKFGKPYPFIQSQNPIGISGRIVNGLWWLEVPIGGTFSGVLSWSRGVSQISWTSETKARRDIIFTFAKPDVRRS